MRCLVHYTQCGVRGVLTRMVLSPVCLSVSPSPGSGDIHDIVQRALFRKVTLKQYFLHLKSRSTQTNISRNNWVLVSFPYTQLCRIQSDNTSALKERGAKRGGIVYADGIEPMRNPFKGGHSYSDVCPGLVSETTWCNIEGVSNISDSEAPRGARGLPDVIIGGPWLRLDGTCK